MKYQGVKNFTLVTGHLASHVKILAPPKLFCHPVPQKFGHPNFFWHPTPNKFFSYPLPEMFANPCQNNFCHPTPKIFCHSTPTVFCPYPPHPQNFFRLSQTIICHPTPNFFPPIPKKICHSNCQKFLCHTTLLPKVFATSPHHPCPLPLPSCPRV